MRDHLCICEVCLREWIFFCFSSGIEKVFDSETLLMQAFEGKNMESAKARLILCVKDRREELSRSGSSSTISSELGALLGMLGDCW